MICSMTTLGMEALHCGCSKLSRPDKPHINPVLPSCNAAECVCMQQQSFQCFLTVAVSWQFMLNECLPGVHKCMDKHDQPICAAAVSVCCKPSWRSLMPRHCRQASSALSSLPAALSTPPRLSHVAATSKLSSPSTRCLHHGAVSCQL